MSPITRFTLAFTAGIALGLRSANATVAMVATLWFLSLLHARLRSNPYVVITFFLVSGFVAGTTAADRASEDCRARIADGATVSVVGLFDGRVTPDTTMYVLAETLRSGGRTSICQGAMRVRVSASALREYNGGHAQLSGRWWAFPEADGWPVPPERTGTLIVNELRPAGTDHGRHPVMQARVAAEERVRRLFGARAGLAEALLLARRGGLDPEVRTRFAAAGMAHVLAISGMHVGILAGVLLLVARIGRFASAPAAIFAAIGTLAYVAFLGAPWAAARAAIQAVMLLASRLFQRPADAVALLAATALVLLAIDPLALLDAGFQLSFAGMWGILVLRRPLAAAMDGLAAPAMRDAVLTSLAAMLATTPIAAMHFGQASIIGLVTNLAASPVLAACVPALAVTLVTDLVSHGGAGAIAGGTGLLLDALDWIATSGARVPGGHFVVSTNALFVALIAALVFVLAGSIGRDPERRLDASAMARTRGRRMALRLAAAFLVWTSAPLFVGGGSGRVEIHAIDVGQGDAFAIRSPRGRWLLVDAGPRSDSYDAGRSRVVPFLLRQGVRRIEAIILTHPHADHIGGTEAVLEAIDVGSILDPSVPAGQAMYSGVLSSARRHGVRWFAGRAGREISLDGMTLRVLSPEDSLLDARGDPNDYSVVFHLGYGRFGALFLGDAPRSIENRLVARFGAGIASDVIKVGHHGSRTSTGDSLLHATRARIALVPVGTRNRYGHPSPEVIMRLTRSGVRVLRTDENGTLVVRGGVDGIVDVAVSR